MEVIDKRTKAYRDSVSAKEAIAPSAVGEGKVEIDFEARAQSNGFSTCMRCGVALPFQEEDRKQLTACQTCVWRNK